MHLSSSFPTGTFGIRSGALTSATDRFDIQVIGKGGHSAFPETCVDPIVTAAQIITALQTVVARRIRAVEPAVVSVCMVQGGQAYNIIPVDVTITGSTRTFDRETRRTLPQTLEQIVRGVCDAAGASYTFRFSLGYASVINDPDLTQFGRQLVQDTFGKGAALEIEPLMPGEDFSALQENCPGFFVELGARNEATGCTVPPPQQPLSDGRGGAEVRRGVSLPPGAGPAAGRVSPAPRRPQAVSQEPVPSAPGFRDLQMQNAKRRTSCGCPPFLERPGTPFLL